MYMCKSKIIAETHITKNIPHTCCVVFFLHHDAILAKNKFPSTMACAFNQKPLITVPLSEAKTTSKMSNKIQAEGKYRW